MGKESSDGSAETTYSGSGSYAKSSLVGDVAHTYQSTLREHGAEGETYDVALDFALAGEAWTAERRLGHDDHLVRQVPRLPHYEHVWGPASASGLGTRSGTSSSSATNDVAGTLDSSSTGWWSRYEWWTSSGSGTGGSTSTGDRWSSSGHYSYAETVSYPGFYGGASYSGGALDCIGDAFHTAAPGARVGAAGPAPGTGAPAAPPSRAPSPPTTRPRLSPKRTTRPP